MTGSSEEFLDNARLLRLWKIQNRTPCSLDNTGRFIETIDLLIYGCASPIFYPGRTHGGDYGVLTPFRSLTV